MKDSEFFRRIFLVGMKYGILNFVGGGIRSAGFKRSLGFILQPVENWSRYPEFHSVYTLQPALTAESSVLDLGSPKMFGIFLSNENAGKFLLTDIWPVAVNEFKTVVNYANRFGKGKVKLGIEDAANLSHIPDNSLDHVYSISVLEHIRDRSGTIAAIKEVERVLKPSGVFTLSLPVAAVARDVFMQQSVYKEDFKGEPAFFAHYYSAEEIQDICTGLDQMKVHKFELITYRLSWLPLKMWCRVPQKLRGVLGFVNLAIAPFTYFKQGGSDIQNLNVVAEGDVVIKFVKV